MQAESLLFRLSSCSSSIRSTNLPASLMPIEFEFPATPELANKALRYLLWGRGGPLGPIAIILLPVVIAVMAADPAMRPVAYIAGARRSCSS